MGLTLIEAYVVINASVFLMGFGGSEWTREYAMAMIRGSLAIGVKLFVLTLIVGLIMTAAKDWQLQYTQDESSTFTLLGMAFAAACLVKIVPDMMGSLISGVSPGGGGVIGGMAAAGMAFGAGAAATLASSMGTGGVLGGIGQQLGGVADLLKGSGSGGSPGGGRGGASFMNSMNSGSSGDASSGPGPRVGGGGRSHSVPPASTGTSSSTGNSPKSGGGNMAQAQDAASPKSMSGAEKAHMAADMAVRTAGAAVSIAMPGAESAHSVSVGPPPTPPDLSSSTVSMGETPENMIRPDTSGSYEDHGILTMEGLQEKLNSQGKS